MSDFYGMRIISPKKGVFFNVIKGKITKMANEYIKCPQNAKALCMSVAKNDAETGQARAGQI